jgi:hypothetical protein
VTLNDPVYVEAAQALGRVMLGASADDSERVSMGFERCLLRLPEDQELQALQRLLADVRADLASRPDDARLLTTDPLGPLPDGMSVIDAAAFTVVANVLLNADEMLLKP